MYEVTFTPANRVVQRPVTIYFNYPSSVGVHEDTLTEEPDPTTGETKLIGKCYVRCGDKTSE